MLKIKITPPAKSVEYKYLDVVHDAVVQAFLKTGVEESKIIGHKSEPWNFAVESYSKKENGEFINVVKSLFISTPSSELSKFLSGISLSNLNYTRSLTGDTVNFINSGIEIVQDPILPNQHTLSVNCISPLAIRKQDKKNRSWYSEFGDLDIIAAINKRLSRLADRDISLLVSVDSLFLRSNEKYSVYIPIKKNSNGNVTFVIGMKAPLVLQGSEEDLRFAWYAGIGEKTRMGFGGLSEY